LSGGIYKRTWTKRGGGRLQLMVKWKKSPAQYSKLLPFEMTVDRAFNEFFEHEWKKAFDMAMMTAK